MPPPRSLLRPLAVDRAKKSHNCQHQQSHRIAMGDKRLGVRDGRSIEYYCTACAAKFLGLARERIESLIREIS